MAKILNFEINRKKIYLYGLNKSFLSLLKIRND